MTQTDSAVLEDASHSPPSLQDTSEDFIAGTCQPGDSPHARAADRPYFKVKYAVERLIGAVLLVPMTPLILLVCLLVRLTSKGSPIYRQERLGLHGETFWIYKIRSMYNDAEEDGRARWCVKGDRRVTPLGFWLRKLHLDELPQLINVVQGNMVLVGPRPERPCIAERLTTVIDGYYDRLLVKPGITGLAQINLPPDECDDDVRCKQTLDLCYIREANAWMDIRMTLLTALRIVGISGDGVTRAMGLDRRSLLTGLKANKRTHGRSPVGVVAELPEEPSNHEETEVDCEIAVARRLPR